MEYPSREKTQRPPYSTEPHMPLTFSLWLHAIHKRKAVVTHSGTRPGCTAVADSTPGRIRNRSINRS
jgi:hypothetical protein